MIGGGGRGACGMIEKVEPPPQGLPGVCVLSLCFGVQVSVPSQLWCLRSWCAWVKAGRGRQGVGAPVVWGEGRKLLEG